jgi:hypothetical protein
MRMYNYEQLSKFTKLAIKLYNRTYYLYITDNTPQLEYSDNSTTRNTLNQISFNRMDDEQNGNNIKMLCI